MSELTVAGRYRILRQLAEGGMGLVLLARTEGPAGFSKTVVLKTLHRHLADDLSFLEFFLAEARLAALLHHPNVAQVFELIEEGSEYFLAMEYVRGKSLRQLLARSGPVPVALAVSIVSQVARALHHAHSATDEALRPLYIVHRDVTPENVLVSWDGGVKLVDFGLAGAKSRRAGKRDYLAPEVLEGGAATASSDIFSAATVLVELMTGSLPLNPLALPAPAEGLRELLTRTLGRDRPSLASTFADELDAAGRAHGLNSSAGELAAFLVETFGPVHQDDLAEDAPKARTALLTEHGVVAAAVVNRPRRWPWVLGGTALLASVGGLALVIPRALVTPPLAAAAAVPMPPPALGPTAQVVPPPVAARVVQEEAAHPRPKAAPRPGWLDARISPWAEVYVDGRRVGTTPMRPLELPAGPHRVELRNGELDVKTVRQVRVRAGETQVLRVDLLDLLSDG